MTELSNSYIKGFVKTCFDAGIHEKQAAALLDYAAENSDMRKEAAGGPSVVKGLGDLASAFVNIGGGLAVGGGKGLGALIGIPLKGIKGYHNNVVMPNFKNNLAKKEYLNALLHLGVFGGAVPAGVLGGGAYAFQNWRNDSKSGLADYVNSVLGNPEFLVLGNKSSYNGYIPTGSLSLGGGSSPLSVDSPNNIPGTTTFNAGSSSLGGSSDGGSLQLPSNLLEIAKQYKALGASKKALRDGATNSSSATLSARGGGNAVREIEEQMAELRDQFQSGINAYNKDVTANNAARAAEISALSDRIAKGVAADKAQAGVGYNRPEHWWQSAANSALETVGARWTDQDAVEQATKLNNDRARKRALERTRDQATLDIGKATRAFENLAN